jgi:S1 RNA binding domain protein
MDYVIGSILTGKVVGITRFGAFVSLPDERSGLVHISEISNTFVNDVREHLTEGQEVTVKLVSIDKDGRINLSIKKAREQPRFHSARSAGGPQTFEDKLKAFMSDSESKQSDIRHHTDKRGSHRRR